MMIQKTYISVDTGRKLNVLYTFNLRSVSTGIQGHEMHKIESSSEGKLHLYCSGHKKNSVAGTGIIVRPNSNVNITPISEKIHMMKVKSNNNTKTNILSAYGPILKTTVKKPEATRALFENLSSIIKTFKAREALIIGGGFNTKTKSKFNNYSNNIIAKYAKSDISINSEKQLNFVYCIILILTWKSPATYVNQIDRSSHPEMFLGKGVLKIYNKFTGEDPCRSVISIKSHFGMGVLL